MKRHGALLLLVLATALASGQYRAPSVLAGRIAMATTGTNWYFDEPSDKSPVVWDDSCVMLVRRTTAPLRLKGLPQTPTGELSIETEVLQASREGVSPKLILRIGRNLPYDAGQGGTFDSQLAQQCEASFPKQTTYLVIVSRQHGADWGEVKNTVPRLIVPVPSTVSVSTSATSRGKMLDIVFRALCKCPPSSATMTVQWLYAEWHSEETSALQRLNVSLAKDPRLFAITHDPADAGIAERALSLSEKADATSRIYITFFAGLWGGATRFRPFFDACKDVRAQPDVATLDKSLISPTFAELSPTEALALVQQVPHSLTGVILKFVDPHQKFDIDDMKALFLLSKDRPAKTRLQIYQLLFWQLQPEFALEHPGKFRPYGKAGPVLPENGIIREDQLRQDWEDYLGISHPNRP